ncbi:transglutaminase superfamily protein [Chitinophaga skermanii]|uniref:Transglutaminase superfamily protein n=1 Tax=Chitinophaga skermanii TaxID=331697 RepID=A0A327QUA0_9BACT|nr:DUF3857 domain-containing protein [Chitinophaga skermanii]RAJ05327.1 transglutaminase superfamily protein [Chitinophaga skermanii]
MKFKRLLSLLIATFCSTTLLGQDPGKVNLAVSEIPPGLLKNADAVIRYDYTSVVMNNLRDVREVTRMAFTILNESAKDDAQIVYRYSKNAELRNVRAALYDANGKLVRKLKQSELSDVSGVDGSSLISDERIKTFNFYYNVYPYTIVVESEYKINTSLFIPGWRAVSDARRSVQSSSYEITVPAGYQLNFRKQALKGDLKTWEEKGTKTYAYSLEQFEAVPEESYAKPLKDRVPSIMVSPSDFEMGNYTGNLNDWLGFGKFLYELNAGRDVLPPNIKQKVHELTDGISDPKEKAAILYRFMQNNTRYISIQLGIGGLQTFDALSVAKNNYGDCKALSNYMMAMLKEVNIPSYCAAIYADQYYVGTKADFPSSSFNHMILCIPFSAKDTTWLECTSQTKQFGFLGSFTANRPALLVTPNGGVLVNTPAYTAKENALVRSVSAKIINNSDVELNVNTRYIGLQQEGLYEYIHSRSEEQQLNRLKEDIDLPSYEVTKFKYNIINGTSIPELQELLELKALNYVSASGKRLFIVPNMISKNRNYLKTPTKPRTEELVLRLNFHDMDSVQIDLPAGYVLESLPSPVALSTKFGEYKAHVEVKDMKLVLVRSEQRKSGNFPAEDYPAYVNFINAITDADAARVVLVKKE